MSPVVHKIDTKVKVLPPESRRHKWYSDDSDGVTCPHVPFVHDLLLTRGVGTGEWSRHTSSTEVFLVYLVRWGLRRDATDTVGLSVSPTHTSEDVETLFFLCEKNRRRPSSLGFVRVPGWSLGSESPRHPNVCPPEAVCPLDSLGFRGRCCSGS